MFEIFDMLLVGFAVGLSGALMPGPMLFATIDSSLKRGWIAGPEVVFGHALLELVIAVLIVLGLTSFIGSEAISIISVVGGIVLIVFGAMTIKGASDASEALHSDGAFVSSPVMAGILTSASNPYFWIWWLAAGSALVMRGLEISLIAVAFFVIGHWMADLGWYSLVSASFSRGKSLMSSKTYERILVSCGVFLIVFGAWFAIG
ncbi:MAG TPA: LysE family translocator [Methanosarcinaceae archaeon]|nr:LysE family translocator [Methanosarcinaceae archaeon]